MCKCTEVCVFNRFIDAGDAWREISFHSVTFSIEAIICHRKRKLKRSIYDITVNETKIGCSIQAVYKVTEFTLAAVSAL